MITIVTSDRTLAGAQFRGGALWELVASLFLLGRGRVPQPYQDWAAPARAALGRPECEPLHYLADRPGWFPDFLLPTPPSGDVDAEVERLAAAAPERVRDEVRSTYGTAPPPALAPYVADPAGALARLGAAYASFWRRSLRPLLPRMHDLLDAEVLSRGRILASGGADTSLATLHPRIRWRRPRLDLVKPQRADLDARTRRLVLAPLVFGAGAMLVGWDDRTICVSYPVPSAVRLGDKVRRADSALVLLLGQGRAAVLAALERPASTRALAAQLDLAPSTVSEHLGLLLRAGLVVRHRAGRRVYYQVNVRGRALLELLG